MFKIGYFAPSGVQNFRWKGSPPLTILLLRKLGFFVRYKNLDRSFFRVVTIMHAFDRRTDRQADKRTDRQLSRSMQRGKNVSHVG